MAVTEQDAADAIKLVMDTYGAHLPAEAASAMRTRKPTDIIRILPAAQYRPQFDQYYRNFFAAINSKQFGNKFTIDIANADADVCGSFNCPAFCSPAINPRDRVIYVNNDEPNNFATLCHELCHCISHGNFYPEFYAMGGDNPFILEGVTEVLTRNLTPQVRQVRASLGKYQGNYAAVTGAMLAGSQSEKDMIAFALQGKYTELRGLGAVKPRI